MAFMAKESDQIKKARKKLEKKMVEESALVTPTALKEVQDKMYRWIERHSRDRINLRDKNISVYSLFAENEESAKTTSKFINRLRDQLSEEISHADEAAKGLRGRVKIKKA